MPIRLLALDATLIDRLRGAHPNLYAVARVPRHAYGSDNTVTTVSVPNFLVARPDLDPEVAYRVTRLLFERRSELESAYKDAVGRLNRLAAIETAPLRMHRGATRYYRDSAR